MKLEGSASAEQQVTPEWALAGFLLRSAVNGGASRQVAASIATALWRSVLLGPVPCSETTERLAHIEPVIKAKVAAAATGEAACISGHLRAARNVAEHNFAEPVSELVKAAKRSQRSGRARRRPTSLAGCSGEEASSKARSEDEPEVINASGTNGESGSRASCEPEAELVGLQSGARAKQEVEEAAPDLDRQVVPIKFAYVFIGKPYWPKGVALGLAPALRSLGEKHGNLVLAAQPGNEAIMVMGPGDRIDEVKPALFKIIEEHFPDAPVPQEAWSWELEEPGVARDPPAAAPGDAAAGSRGEAAWNPLFSLLRSSAEAPQEEAEAPQEEAEDANGLSMEEID